MLRLELRRGQSIALIDRRTNEMLGEIERVTKENVSKHKVLLGLTMNPGIRAIRKNPSKGRDARNGGTQIQQK